ncbi:subtilisin-like protein [Lactarius quietus]|nr:subtilisin-like protein [Lactarius quietus]
MIMPFCLLTVLFVFAVAPLANVATYLAPLWDNMQVKHTWHIVPANWEALGHPPPGTTIDLHIALKPHHENALTDSLYEVSDPKHAKYGAHLSKEQVAELVAPHPDTLELVTSWLKHSVSSPVSMTHGGGWLTVPGVPVAQANRLLGASYQLYQYTGTNKTLLRTVGYSLPEVLHEHIQTIVPTTYFSPPRKMQQRPRKRSKEEAKAKATSGGLVMALSSRDDEEVVPAVLRSLYSTEGYVPTAMDRNMLGVAGYSDNSPSQADLTTFMSKYRTDAVDPPTFKVVQVNNAKYDPSDPSSEANMNVQYVAGMGYPTPITYYSIGGESEWEEPSNLPSSIDADFTISISYGNTESGYPVEYTRALCLLFAQLGNRGVSVLIATGDYGVGPGNCEDEAGEVQFVPIFPASSLRGGFSFHFPRPPYQDGTVPKYIRQLGSQYAGLFYPNGRGMPDISAQAYDFMIILGGHSERMHGTSCSAPTVAGVISLLNDYQIARGIAPLGFLNPWLYDQGLKGLNDITSGSNPGCNTDGFSAVIGWDPVTGLGTPDFVKLQKLLPHGPRTG